MEGPDRRCGRLARHDQRRQAPLDGLHLSVPDCASPATRTLMSTATGLRWSLSEKWRTMPTAAA